MAYLISTALLCLALLASAASYLFHQPTIDGVRALGFPDHFRLQLAVLKLLAVLIIAVPSAPMLAKEWAYAGLAFFLLTAIVAHSVHGDPWTYNLANGVLLALLFVSRFYKG
jgi:hypothetical protein